MAKIPQEKIKDLNDIPIEEVADAMELKRYRHRALCFMHDDHHPSLYFNTNTNSWRCFACEKGGNVISLVMSYMNLDFLSACRWLATEFKVDLENELPCTPILPRKRKPRPPKPKKSIDYDLYHWVFQKAGLSPRAQRFLYDQRHYSPEVVTSLGIASITDPLRFADGLVAQFGPERSLKSGLLRTNPSDNPSGDHQLSCAFATPCLIFPYRDIQGRIISVQSRHLGSRTKVPRFQFIKGSAVSIFNQPVLATLAPDEPLYIAEGVTDCLALMTLGHKAVAVPGATLLKAKDIVLFTHRNLYMYPDADAAGQHLYDKLSALLAPHNTSVTRLSLPPNCKDISDTLSGSKK